MSVTRPILVNSLEAAHHLSLAFDVHVSPATIRSWAKRGHIRIHAGLYRYDLREVEQCARQRGLIAN